MLGRLWTEGDVTMSLKGEGAVSINCPLDQSRAETESNKSQIKTKPNNLFNNCHNQTMLCIHI